MALDNLIQRADLNLRLTRALEIKGQKSPILQLDSIVTPTVLVEDLTVQEEYSQPIKKRVGFCANVAAVAGQNVLGVLLNPVGSGIVVVVRMVQMRASGTSEVVMGFADPLALPATPVAPIFFDNRHQGVSPVVCRVGTDAVLRIVGELMRYNTGTTTVSMSDLPDRLEIVVNPGQAFGVQHVIANLTGAPSLWWDEYPA